MNKNKKIQMSVKQLFFSIIVLLTVMFFGVITGYKISNNLMISNMKNNMAVASPSGVSNSPLPIKKGGTGNVQGIVNYPIGATVEFYDTLTPNAHGYEGTWVFNNSIIYRDVDNSVIKSAYNVSSWAANKTYTSLDAENFLKGFNLVDGDITGDLYFYDQIESTYQDANVKATFKIQNKNDYNGVMVSGASTSGSSGNPFADVFGGATFSVVLKTAANANIANLERLRCQMIAKDIKNPQNNAKNTWIRTA